MTTIHSRFIKKEGHIIEVFSNGDVYNVARRKMLRRSVSNGYQIVCINYKKFYVHRLIAEAFLGYSDKATVNHLDGNKKNNVVDNIEYATHSKNMTHAWQTGLQPRRRRRGKVYKNMTICELCVACYGYDGGYAFNKVNKLLKNKDYKMIDKLIKNRGVKNG